MKNILLVFVLLLGPTSPVMAREVLASEGNESPRFAYVANAWDYVISAYTIDNDGLLQPNGGYYTHVKLLPMIIAHPNGKFLYTASRTVDKIPAFKINPDNGSLSEIEGSPFDAEIRSPFQYAFHPSGKFLYMAARSGAVTGYVIDSETGALSPVPAAPFKAGERTRCLAVHPSGKFVYATNAYTNDISVFRVDQTTGSLTEIENSPFNAGENQLFDDSFAPLLDAPQTAIGLPYYIDIHPSGDYAYVTNWRAASISMFRLNQTTGDMTLIDKPVLTGLTPYPVAVHPSGRYVYAANWASNDVWVYKANQQSGMLDLIENAQTELRGVKPVAMRFNSLGDMLYVTNVGSNNVSVLEVDIETGLLALKQTVRARAGPVDVAVVNGKGSVGKQPHFAFLLDSSTNTLNVNKVDSSDGEFVQVAKAAIGQGAMDVVHSPNGRFVYTADTDSNQLSGFVVDENNGQLTEIKGFPFRFDVSPTNLEIDGFGWYLYIENKETNLVHVYLIHKDTGQIAEVRHSPIHLSMPNASMDLDYTARFAYFSSPENKRLAVYRHLKTITPALYEIDKLGSPFSMPGSISKFITHPLGHYGLAVYSKDDKVALYQVHEGSGGLYDLSSETYPVPANPVSAVFSSKGDYLVIMSRAEKALTLFSVDVMSGEMEALYTLPVVSKNQLKDMIMSPSGEHLYLTQNPASAVIRIKWEYANQRLSQDGLIAKDAQVSGLTISTQY